MAETQQEILTLFAKLAEGDFTYRVRGDDILIRQANDLAGKRTECFPGIAKTRYRFANK